MDARNNSNGSTSISTNANNMVFTTGKYIEIEEVRISPPEIELSGAFDGKTFTEKIHIQNCGRSAAWIIVTKPNSKFFQVAGFESAGRRHIPPGLSTVLTVTYTHRAHMEESSRGAQLPICINGKWLTYRILVKLSEAEVSVVPHILDFGRIDIGMGVASRHLTVTNRGTKASRFDIDVGTDDVLCIQPKRGVVDAKSSITVLVELETQNSSEDVAGQFRREIWFKDIPRPCSIVILAHFVIPKLDLENLFYSKNFDCAILEFPRTYYGARTVRSVTLRNCGSTSCHFAVYAAIFNELVPLRQAESLDFNYRNFRVEPLEGRIYANRTTQIQITFEPIPNSTDQNRTFCQCLLRIVKIDFKRSRIDYQSGEPDRNPHLIQHELQRKLSELSKMSLLPTLMETDELTFVTTFPSDICDVRHSMTAKSRGHYRTICLHGDMECAQLIFKPARLAFGHIDLGATYTVPLELVNRSQHLPVTVVYEKVPAIEVVPQQLVLGPKTKNCMKLTLKPTHIGPVQLKLRFLLLNCGGDEMVGTAHVPLQYDIPAVTTVPKIREQREDQYRNLITTQEYHLTESELELKCANRQKYKELLQQQKVVQKNEFQYQTDDSQEDYDVANEKLVLAEHIPTHFVDCTAKNVVPQTLESKRIQFNDLSAFELNLIQIRPTVLRCKVCILNTTRQMLTVENGNDFPIRITLKTSHFWVTVPQDTVIVPPGQKRNLDIIVTGIRISGRAKSMIYVFVNESDFYQVLLIAFIIPKVVVLLEKHVEFVEGGESLKFIQLRNYHDSTLEYEWTVTKPGYDIFPKSGQIPANCTMTAMVTVRNCTNGTTEAIIISEGGYMQSIQLNYSESNVKVPDVGFESTTINFDLVPLNQATSKFIVMTNFDNRPVQYRIVTDDLPNGTEIVPIRGVLHSRSDQLFEINVKLRRCIKFHTKITVLLQNKYPLVLQLNGTVEYPKVHIEPDYIDFKKVPTNSTTSQMVQIKNHSKFRTQIDFHMHKTPGFKITHLTAPEVPLEEGTVILEPQELRKFLLYFKPKTVSSYRFYLPMCINGILGSVSGYPEISTPLQFIPDSNPSMVPSQLPILSVGGYADKELLTFSALELRFRYYGAAHAHNTKPVPWRITNPTEKRIELCIGLNYTVANVENSVFRLVPSSDEYQIRWLTNTAIMFCVESGQSVLFDIWFQPQYPGTYNVKLPILLRHYLHFNFLKLNGTYEEPVMVPVTGDSIVYLPPVPLQVTVTKTVLLDFRYHLSDCRLSFKTDHINSNSSLRIHLEPPQRPNNGGGTFQRSVIFDFTASVPISICGTVHFECSCGSWCYLNIIATAEDCLLTSYLYLTSLPTKDFLALSNELRNTSSDRLLNCISTQAVGVTSPSNTSPMVVPDWYPSFPNDLIRSEQSDKLRNIVEILEEWLFHQGFFSQKYHRIPDGFAMVPVVVLREKGFRRPTKPPPPPPLPIVQLILNLAGNHVRKYLIPNTDCLVPIDEHCLSVYKNVLNFLQQMGATLPHVQPEFLLNKPEYNRNSMVVPYEQYYWRMKQCWLDVILQTIKVLILNRINIVLVPIVAVPKLYGKPEAVLLSWLRECYEKLPSDFWRFTETKPVKRILNFEYDLSDGLVLGACTALYTPYLQDLLANQLTRDDLSVEERFHNCCVVLKVWRMLNFTFDITPRQLVEGGNFVQMLLLVAYLYDVLPNYKSRDGGSIIVHAPMGGHSDAHIDLRNTSPDQTATYRPLFFQNTNECFHLVSGFGREIRLKPRQTVRVPVRYYAKSVDGTTATLVLNGETSGGKCARTMTLNLIGVCELTSSSTNRLNFNVDLYRLTEVDLILHAPNKMEASYKVMYCFQGRPPEDSSNWCATPRDIFFPTPLVFDKRGVAVLKPTLCCLSLGVRTLWVFFTNQEVGDWGIEIRIEVVPPKAQALNLTVELPPDFCTMKKCTCGRTLPFRDDCARVVPINLPCRNHYLWSAMRELVLLKKIDTAEVPFWEKMLNSPVGFHILGSLLGMAPTNQMTYRVSTVRRSGTIKIPPLVEIHDITDDGTVVLPVHVNTSNSKTGSKPDLLQLQSIDGAELRVYRLTFDSCGVQTPTNDNGMDPQEFRKFAKAAVDYIADYMETIENRPVVAKVRPGYLQDLIPQEAPEKGDSWQNVLLDVERIIMPGVTHWSSPHFHGFYPTGCSLPSIVAELISAGLSGVGISWLASPVYTELEVVMMNWLGRLLHLPDRFLNSAPGPGGGCIQSSASEATLVALLAAKARLIRHLLAEDPKLCEEQLRNRLVAYSSNQSNSSVEKAGLLGGVPMRLLEADGVGALRGPTLEQAIRADVDRGLIPCYVVANLGTTPTCAFDNLNELSLVCQRYKCWLHVDAAYAGSAFILPEYRHLMDGCHLADSFNFNPHKWMLVNFDCSALWVADAGDLVAAFNVQRVYLQEVVPAADTVVPEYRHWQISLGRRFRALKLWFVMRMYGVEGLQRHIRHQIGLAQYFAQLVGVDRRFEVVACSMGLVCFRLKLGDGATVKLLNTILERKRIYVVEGHFRHLTVIRFAICSRLTERKHVEYAWTEFRTQTDHLFGPSSRKIGLAQDVPSRSTDIIKG